MNKFSMIQVSLFYLVLIAVLGYIGFVYGSRIGASIGIAVGDALGSALGAMIGVLVSYKLFLYVRENRMLK